MGVVDTFWRYPADITVNHVFITGFPCMSPVLSRWVLQCSAYRPHPDGPSEFYKIMHERTELQFDWLKKLKEYIGTVIRSNRGSCRMRQTVCPTMYLTKGTLVILKMVSGWVSRSDLSSGVDRGHRRMWNNCVVLVLEIWGHFLSSLGQRPLEATSIFSFAMPLSIYHSLREKIGRAITRVEFQVNIQGVPR